MTKKQAIIKALQELGSDASSAQVQSYCREKFGIFPMQPHISHTRSLYSGKRNKPVITIEQLTVFKELIKKEGGIAELRGHLAKAKLLNDMANEVGGWTVLDQIFNLFA